MAISRAQMGSQLTGNKMKKTKKMALGGKVIEKLSPAVALANSLKSGKAEGILGMTGLGAMYNAAQRGRGDGAASAMPQEAGMTATGAMERPQLPTRGMKKGGKVRGDGVCQRGHTKGTMR
jgi:hypothetical protein